MKSEYENRQHNLKPGEVYMIRRHFKQADGKPFSFYEWSHEYPNFWGCYENALNYVKRMQLEYGTWEIVKMVPIPRELDGLEVITFKGQPADG